MEKTIHEWFLEAKENGADWVDAAIKTTIELRGQERLDLICGNLREALFSAFAWQESLDGADYWKKIARSVKNA